MKSLLFFFLPAFWPVARSLSVELEQAGQPIKNASKCQIRLFFPAPSEGQEDRMQKGLLNYFQPKAPAGPGPAASSVSAMLKGV